MAIVQLSTQADQLACLEVTKRCGQTILNGRDGDSVHIIPDLALEELDERGASYTLVDQADLPQLLSPSGLEYLQFIEREHPELLSFDATLPPAFHVGVTFKTPAGLEAAVQQTLEQVGGHGVSYEPVEGERIIIQSKSVERRSMLRFRCVIAASVFERLQSTLQEKGLAGFSPETAIFVESDPDGSLNQS